MVVAVSPSELLYALPQIQMLISTLCSRGTSKITGLCDVSAQKETQLEDIG
jgi:hypothetical protein